MRHKFGGIADYVISLGAGNAATLQPGASVTCWNNAVGGTQYTDLTDIDGSTSIAAGVLTTNAQGAIPEFYGPDGVTDLYFEVPGGQRRRTLATDLGTSLTDLETAVASMTPADIGALPAAGGTVSGDLTVNGRLSGPVGPYGVIAPTRSGPAWRKANTSFQFQSGHGWTANGTAGSNLNNTSAPVRGTQYASITTNTSQGMANLVKTGMTPFSLTGKTLRLICRISDVSKLASLNVFVGTSNFANNFKWRLWQVSSNSQLGSSNEWLTLTFGWASVNSTAGTFTMSSTGVPSTTSGFTDMQVQAISTAGQSITLDVQSIDIIDATSTVYPQGVCSIVFDDGAQSIWDYARPVMDTYGYQGTNYVIAGNLGTGNYMTLAQNQQLQNFSGWEIGLHAYSGAIHDGRDTSLTAAEVDDDMRKGKQWLVQNGFRGESMAYPGGEYQKTTDGVGVDAITARYFTSGRTILFQSGYPTESYPAGMPYRLRAVSSISSTQTGANNPANMVAAGGLLDKCKNNGTWLILVFHKLTAGAATIDTECSQADFQTIMAGINSRGIPVMPVGDVMRRAT